MRRDLIRTPNFSFKNMLLFLQKKQVWNYIEAVLLVIGIVWEIRRFIYWRYQFKPSINAPKKSEPLPQLVNWPALSQVTMLVAAWNEEEQIEAFLKNFIELEYPNLELILCAGGSDRTFEIAKNYTGSRLHLLRQEVGEGKLRSLQRSLQHATGEIIYFTDADCILNTESFQRIIYPICCGKEVATSGCIRPFFRDLNNSLAWYQWHIWQHKFTTLSNESDNIHFIGGNFALSRKVLEAAWSDREKSSIVEDYYLSLRVISAGHKIAFVHDSYVETEFPTTYAYYMSNLRRISRGKLITDYQFGDINSVREILTLSLKSQLFFLMPVFYFLIGRLGLVLWLLGWLHTALSYIYQICLIFDQNGSKVSSNVLSLWWLRLLLVERWAKATILVEMLNPQWRRRW